MMSSAGESSSVWMPRWSLLHRCIQTDDDSPAELIIPRDHFGATLPGIRARLRLEFPPIRTDIELIDAGQNPCHGVLPRFAIRAGDDFEQQLASLRATGRGEPQEVTLLSMAQLWRIIRVIQTQALDRELGGPVDEMRREAIGPLKLERPRAWPFHGSSLPQVPPRSVAQGGGTVGRIQQYSEAFSTGRYTRGGINRQQFESGEALGRCMQANRDLLELLPMINSERQQGPRAASAGRRPVQMVQP